MTRRQLNVRLPDTTIRQLAELAEQYESQAHVIILAIDRMYQTERISTMNTATQTVTVKDVEAKPQYDPMVNIAGHCTRSVFWLDCERQQCGVTQEMDDNATTFHRFHGHELAVHIPEHPQEDTIRQYIEDNMELFERIVAGYESVWDGSNHRARYTEDANQAWMAFCEAVEAGAMKPGYAYIGTLEEYYAEWMRTEITADMTDAQIERLAHETIELDSEENVDGLQLVFDRDAADTLTDLCRERRDELREEAE